MTDKLSGERIAAIQAALRRGERTISAEDAHALLAEVIRQRKEEIIFANMLVRGRDFERMPSEEQLANAHAAWRYGGWLRDEAKKHHALVIPALPQETLFERALALVAR